MKYVAISALFAAAALGAATSGVRAQSLESLFVECRAGYTYDAGKNRQEHVHAEQKDRQEKGGEEEGRQEDVLNKLSAYRPGGNALGLTVCHRANACAC